MFFPPSLICIYLHYNQVCPLSPSGMDVDIENQGTTTDLYLQPGSLEDGDQGWVSWAWSFVPAIVDAEEESEEDLYQQRETGSIPNCPQQHTHKDPIVSIGFYCTKASVTFKVNQLLLYIFFHV